MSETNAEQYDWIDEALEELKDPNKEIVLRPRQQKKTEEKDEFDELDEMFLNFNNKMIEIKDRLKTEKEEMNKLITSCEFENAQLKLDNKELDESNSKLEEKNKELEERVKDLERQNFILEENNKELLTCIKDLHQGLIKDDFMDVLMELPPSMHSKNNNENYPIVRFAALNTGTLHTWYCKYIGHLNEVYHILRQMHQRSYGNTKLHIVAAFHYRNFPAKDWQDLKQRSKYLADMLKRIDPEHKEARLLIHINYLDDVPIPTPEQIATIQTEEAVAQMLQEPEEEAEVADEYNN